MSSSSAAHRRKNGATVDVATSAASRADEAGIGVMTGLTSKFGSLMSGSGDGEGRATTEERRDTSYTGKGLKAGNTVRHRTGSRQQNRKKESSSSSAPRRPTSPAATAASNLNNVNHHERRFAEYKLANINQPLQRGGGSRGGGWGRTGRGKGWLRDYLNQPRLAELEQVVYYEDDLCVVIYDGFPKAQYHLLLLAKDPPVQQLTDLRREHLPPQRRLHDVGYAIAEELCRQGAGSVRCGYHAIPSVEPLHVHIVSQDFDSPDMFRNSHWNGFTTDFFLDCSWVEAQVQERGRLVLDHRKYTRLETQPAQCFRCGWAASVGSLKRHSLVCSSPLPEGWRACRREKRSRKRKPKKKVPPSSEPPPTSASTAAAATTTAAAAATTTTAAAATAATVALKATKMIHPERRFAGYKLANINQPLRRGGGSRGGGWGTTGCGKGWLQDYLNEPRRPELEEVVYYEDGLCVVIYDGFPKARYHLLLLAKDLPVQRLTDLRREHLPLQRRLHDAGKMIAEELCRQGAGQVRCGYHAIPSVEPLHMHIVSQDFDSPDLFNKAHWNGFTTEFFLDCSWVEMQVQQQGRLVLDQGTYRRLLKQPVRCSRCGWAAEIGPLKRHHLECTAPLPGGTKAGRGKST